MANEKNSQEHGTTVSDNDTLHTLLRFGPAGLHPDTIYEASDPKWQLWQRHVRQYLKGMLSREEISPLIDYLIHLSIVSTTSDMAMVHYSFENLWDEEVSSNICSQLFTLRRNTFMRVWQSEEVASGQRNEYRLPLEFLGPEWGALPTNPSRPEEVLTVTQKAHRKEDGSWFVCHFGACLPGHTYKLQLIYGGLPSNVFIWTVPE